MHITRFSMIMLIGLAGCSDAPATASKLESTSVKSPFPITMTVKQRSTTRIPGLEKDCSLTVGDITRGQVMVSTHFSDDMERATTGLVSLKPGEATELKIYKASYTIRLTELSNALVGEDFATFEIGGLSESQKIDKLISSVESLKDARFIRNGTEYSAQEAAEHLRLKLKNAGDSIQTASQFIEHVASKSSLSGEVYLIRLSDGSTLTARDFFEQELAKLE
ncbi:MAG: DUF5329 domain-containing protein [Planctomycetia bacterium]|nr:DUF5329 domain-containing protein [Planctomycetia bacterium]